MDETLAERHIRLASHAEHAALLRVSTMEKTQAATWEPGRWLCPDYVDFGHAISGDDLARLNSFGPKRKPSIWLDILRGAA